MAKHNKTKKCRQNASGMPVKRRFFYNHVETEKPPDLNINNNDLCATLYCIRAKFHFTSVARLVYAQVKTLMPMRFILQVHDYK